MNFSEAKKLIVEALLADNYLVEARKDTSKNLLTDGLITNQEAAAIVARTTGNQVTTSPHHFDSSYLVWVFRPVGWYTKFYIRENTIVISFHRSE